MHTERVSGKWHRVDVRMVDEQDPSIFMSGFKWTKSNLSTA